jgi:Flp pilus assembly protein TadG
MRQLLPNSPKITLRIENRPQIAHRRSRLRCPSSSETGGTLVEAAVTMTLLLMCIFGIMDCSRALYVNHYVRYTAEEAARYAMVRGSTWNNASCATTQTESCTATSANIASYVTSITPAGINTGNNLSVATLWTGKSPSGANCSATNVTNSPGCVVQVQVSYNFNFVLPFLPANALQMGSQSSVAISQ